MGGQGMRRIPHPIASTTDLPSRVPLSLMEDPESRREFLGGLFTSAGKIVTRRLQPAVKSLGREPSDVHVESFLPLLRPPDSVRVYTEADSQRLESLRGGMWAGDGVSLKSTIFSDRHRLTLEAPDIEPVRIAVRWQGGINGVRRYLCDHWERSYGDSEWRAEVPDRPLPWYFLAYDGKRTHGYGVMVRPRAFCFWTADRTGITLWLDVRNGGRGVRLGDREVDLCEIVCREGDAGENPFEAHRAFCRMMCPYPRLTAQSVYGTNDWYQNYGQNSAEQILETSRIVAELAPNVANRPFSVIDAGWSPGGSDQGPYLAGTERFGDMGAFSSQLKDIGVRPGLWIRPLAASPETPDSWRLRHGPKALDPTHPEAADHISRTVAQAVDWGYELIKHDFSSYDLMGRWGGQMGASLTGDDWSFHDRSLTTAEVVNDFYDRIRSSAGMTYLMGCNTFSHLSAGVFELNRIGDDTSGRDWNRTRRMGVNALAFRGAQQGIFYGADADVAALTRTHREPPALDWLRLLSMSGTPLFISFDPSVLGPHEWAAIRDAFEQAAQERPVAEPLDWLSTATPRRWRIGEEKFEFDWSDPEGPDPFAT
jgi:alpha-galactosidase